jgi:hypothetical protein
MNRETSGNASTLVTSSKYNNGFKFNQSKRKSVVIAIARDTSSVTVLLGKRQIKRSNKSPKAVKIKSSSTSIRKTTLTKKRKIKQNRINEE